MGFVTKDGYAIKKRQYVDLWYLLLQDVHVEQNQENIYCYLKYIGCFWLAPKETMYAVE